MEGSPDADDLVDLPAPSPHKKPSPTESQNLSTTTNTMQSSPEPDKQAANRAKYNKAQQHLAEMREKLRRFKVQNQEVHAKLKEKGAEGTSVNKVNEDLRKKQAEAETQVQNMEVLISLVNILTSRTRADPSTNGIHDEIIQKQAESAQEQEDPEDSSSQGDAAERQLLFEQMQAEQRRQKKN